MHPYVTSLKEFLESHADPETAAPMKKYMRDQFEFLGIPSPQRKALQKRFIAEHGLPPLSHREALKWLKSKGVATGDK